MYITFSKHLDSEHYATHACTVCGQVLQVPEPGNRLVAHPTCQHIAHRDCVAWARRFVTGQGRRCSVCQREVSPNNDWLEIRNKQLYPNAFPVKEEESPQPIWKSDAGARSHRRIPSSTTPPVRFRAWEEPKIQTNQT